MGAVASIDLESAVSSAVSIDLTSVCGMQSWPNPFSKHAVLAGTAVVALAKRSTGFGAHTKFGGPNAAAEDYGASRWAAQRHGCI